MGPCWDTVIKSAWSPQVKGQPAADPLPSQAETAAPLGERWGKLVLPAAMRCWGGSKGHELVRAAQRAAV